MTTTTRGRDQPAHALQTATAWNPSADNTVQALAVSGSSRYARGRLTWIGGQLQPFFAVFHPAL